MMHDNSDIISANVNTNNQKISKHPDFIEVEKAIVVSDVHLGYNRSNTSAFINFLSEYAENGTASEYSLFILGDLWDYWRNHNVIFSPESNDVLSLINRFKDIHYVPGNHDHIVLHAKEDYPDFSCYNISKYFRVKSGDKNFFMLHGHELEVIAKLTYLTVDEYDKISDQLCRMNDEEGKMASYLHEVFHKLVPGRQIEMEDIMQPAEQRKGMDSIDKFARSQAKYPLLGMQLNDTLIFGHTHRPFEDLANHVINTGGWVSDMLIPQWFKEHHGNDKKCSGWYAKIEKGNCELIPYNIYIETKRDTMKESSDRLTVTEGKEDNGKKEEENKNRLSAEVVVERIAQQTSNFVSDLIGKKQKEQT
jgi:UDP-2,3-diacylglucosamine pyrophosphatase LpxH